MPNASPPKKRKLSVIVQVDNIAFVKREAVNKDIPAQDFVDNLLTAARLKAEKKEGK